MTPGQVACETFWNLVQHDQHPPGAAWQWAASQGTQKAWEAAAKAASEWTNSTEES